MDTDASREPWTHDDEPTVIITDPALKQFEGGFTSIPNRILENNELSIGARMTYAMLLKYAWQKGFCHPAQKTLAVDLGLKDRMVRYNLDELRKAGLITWKRRGYNKSNRYYILRLPARRAVSVSPDRQDIADPDGDRQHIASGDRQYVSDEEYSEKKIQNTVTGSEQLLGGAEQRIRADLLVEEMLDTLRDHESVALYRRLALQLPDELIYQALAETREQAALGRIRKSRGAYFTARVRQLADARGIELGLRSLQ